MIYTFFEEIPRYLEIPLRDRLSMFFFCVVETREVGILSRYYC